MDNESKVVNGFHFDKERLIALLRQAGEAQAALILMGLKPKEWEELREVLNASIGAKVKETQANQQRIKEAVVDIAVDVGAVTAAQAVMTISSQWEEAICKMAPAKFEDLSTEEFADKLLDTIKLDALSEAVKEWGGKHGKCNN